MKDYTNSQISALIDEHIHNQRDRMILKDRLINGLVYEVLAEKYYLSVNHTKNIVYKAQNKLFKYL